ncbi:hypothetical protein GCM10009749_27530 [Agromyces neolithicus]|uniref:PH domain-containing protein n=1 Tax=Agromyces neolithicus TaxID=269420 RepID=A0ABN2M9T5_9MICO
MDVGGWGVPEYRPENWWRFLNAFGAAVLLALGLVLAVFAVQSVDPWAYALSGLTLSVGGLWAVRVPRVRVVCTNDSLVVVGSLWTRRVPRRAITSVDHDPHKAIVGWRTARGGWRFTPLTMLWGGTYGWMPQRSRGTRSRFLRHVQTWSRRTN